jgi:hypothetical protein
MGDVIRDGAPIIEHFEAANGRPSQPAGHRQQIISVLFDVIGTDGLLRPATINRVLGGFITAFSEYIALYINKIAEYENFLAFICLKLRLNCALGGFREQLNPWHFV